MKLGFIGFGEASSNIIKGLLGEKTTEIIVYDIDTQKAKNQLTQMDNSEKLEIADTIYKVIDKADVIFSAVPGKADKKVFDSMLNTGVKNKLFVDLCTVLPEYKYNISIKADASGNLYADVAVMGSVPKLLHKVPMLASGSGAAEFAEIMQNYKMDISVIGEKAGDASVIKLCRSIYMKGLAALSIEVDEVSRAYGVENEVFASLAKSMDADDFMSYTRRLINGTLQHCIRRREEMEDCITLVKNKGLSSAMTEGTIKAYDKIIENID